jgi:regulator of cell morphogenesis and NO signaling
MDDRSTTTIDPATPLGDLVTRRPELARHLEARSLDYCCHGARSLGQACAEAGLDTDDVVAELSAAAGDGPAPEWAGLTPTALVDHIEAVHHTYLHAELPRIGALADKVQGVHGARHPELADVRATFDELAAELVPHLGVEEELVFPFVRDLEGGRVAATELEPLRQPIARILEEHDRAGELLERLGELTDRYRPPADACASYTALYAALAELEADTHLHVHKENNLLIPAVLGDRDPATATARA